MEHISFRMDKLITDPHSFHKFFNIYDTEIEENIHFVRLTYQNRAINLDYVILPKDMLVTDVRFCASVHIGLDILATPFDPCQCGKTKLFIG